MSRRAKAAAADGESRAANAERGEIVLLLEDQPYVLRPSHEAIEAFEVATGKGLLQLAREALRQELRLSEVAQIATECIRAWGRATQNRSMQGVSAARVAELILEGEGGLLTALTTVTSMLALATTGGYTAQGEPKAGTTTAATMSEAPAAS